MTHSIRLGEAARMTGRDQQRMLVDGLTDIDWVLEHLNKIKARNSVGEMAQTKVELRGPVFGSKI